MSKRFAATAALAALVAAGLPASAHGAGFRYGVTAGEVRATNAILWTRANRPGKVSLHIAPNRRLKGRTVRTFRLRAKRRDDNTVQKKVHRLKPGRRYWFRFTRGKGGRQKSTRGTFTTAPRSNANVNVEFAWSGDTDAQPLTGRRPFWSPGFPVITRMMRERNQLNFHLGDTIYSDTEVQNADGTPVVPDAVSVKEKWAKYRQNLGQRALQRLRGSAGFYSQWDDHEFLNDFAPPEMYTTRDGGTTLSGTALYARGVRAFRDYSPVAYTPRNGLYRHFRWGRNVEFFILDERSFRSAKASDGGTCDNPQTGEPDLAPTAPQETRNLFAVLVPSLSSPVSQECKDKINDPNRSILGPLQRQRFLRDISRSKATWKIVINEMPIQQYYVLPYDRWEGYEADRQRVLSALSGKVDNVIFLTTDVHATLVNDARFQTLEPGGMRNSGILEVTVGPVSTATFDTEIDRVTGEGNGATVDSTFFEGFLQMQCSEIDTLSYGQVEVTRDKLTVTPKDQNGNPLVNKSANEPCGPFELEAQ